MVSPELRPKELGMVSPELRNSVSPPELRVPGTPELPSWLLFLGRLVVLLHRPPGDGGHPGSTGRRRGRASPVADVRGAATHQSPD